MYTCCFLPDDLMEQLTFLSNKVQHQAATDRTAGDNAESTKTHIRCLECRFLMLIRWSLSQIPISDWEQKLRQDDHAPNEVGDTGPQTYRRSCRRVFLILPHFCRISLITDTLIHRRDDIVRAVIARPMQPRGHAMDGTHERPPNHTTHGQSRIPRVGTPGWP